MSQIIILKAGSSYGALRVFADHLAAALQAMGKKVCMVDFLKKDWVARLTEALKDSCEFVFSYNALGLDLQDESTLLFNKLDIPCVAAMVDHPHYHMSRLSVPLRNMLVTCVDRSHLGFLRSVFPKERFSGMAFWPHAGTESKAGECAVKDRDISIFFGSYGADRVERQWQQNIPVVYHRLLNDITDHALTNESLPLEKVTEHVLNYKGLELGLESKRKLLHMLCYVDSYLRTYRKYHMVKTLVDAGLRIDVCGPGWDVGSMAQKLHVHGMVKFEEMLGLVRRSKISLNVNVNFVNGSHERVANAMINGAVAVTDQSDYYTKYYEDNKELIMYSWRELNKLPMRLVQLLSQPERLVAIAKAGQTKAREVASWDKQAEKLCDLVGYTFTCRQMAKIEDCQ